MKRVLDDMHLRRVRNSASRRFISGHAASVPSIMLSNTSPVSTLILLIILLMQERYAPRLVVFQFTDLMERLDLFTTLSDPFDEVV